MGNQIDPSQLDMNLVSYIIRKKRNEMQLTQKAISDRTVSESTISNIENQEGNVKIHKIYHVLANLGIYKEQLPEIIKKEQTKIDELQFKLEFIEALIEKRDLEEANDELNQISLEEYHPLFPFNEFLKGLYFFKKKEWSKSEKYFKKAIYVFDQYKIKPFDNIIAICYNELSRCYFHQNDFEKALKYATDGLNAFDEVLEKRDIKFPLISNKIFYLISSSQHDQANNLLNEIWPLISQIDHPEVVLDLYKFRVILLRKSKNYSEAIQYCKEGIRIGYRKNSLTRTIDLLLLLGSIYLRIKEYDKADQYFRMAMSLDKDFKFLRRQIDIYNYFGILFTYQEKWSEAEIYLEKAIEIGRQINDVIQLSKSLISKGNCYHVQKQHKKAASYYKEATNILKKHDHKNLQYIAWFKLANCFDMMGKEEELTMCAKKMYLLQHEMKIKGDDFYDLL